MSALAGRRALVTGAGSGIGRAIAIGLGGAGAGVVLAGRRREPLEAVAEELETAGASAAAVPTDVRSEEEVRALIAAANEHLGGIDAVVHAAGVHSLVRSAELDDEELVSVLESNLVGAFRVVREAGRAMLDGNGGAVVTIASLGAIGAFPGRIAYGISKAGVVAMTQTLGVEWADRGVRVNAVIPGFIRTPISDRLVEQGALDLEALERRTPVGRRGEPEEMVGPAVFLLSDAAGFITGQCLVADGGWSAWLGPTDPYGPSGRGQEGR
jgi:NAD(P)-dependent dehydrogenase (short-subunit alcohol dehydrogenase family)